MTEEEKADLRQKFRELCKRVEGLLPPGRILMACKDPRVVKRVLRIKTKMKRKPKARRARKQKGGVA